jgi:hypothetical protein
MEKNSEEASRQNRECILSFFRSSLMEEQSKTEAKWRISGRFITRAAKTEQRGGNEH